jgi:hypothetical protein
VVENVSIPVIANGGSSNNRNSDINTHEGTVRQFYESNYPRKSWVLLIKILCLKILPSEMGPIESGIIQKTFIKETSLEIFFAVFFFLRHVRPL